MTTEWTTELFMKKVFVRAPEPFFPSPVHCVFSECKNHLLPLCCSLSLALNFFFFFVFPLLPWKGEGCWGCGKAGSVISHRVRLLMRPSSQHWQIKCNGKACLLDYEPSPGCQLTPFNYFPSWQKETVSDLSGSLVRWWLSLCHLAGHLAPLNPGLLKTCCTESLGSDFEKFPEMF